VSVLGVRMAHLNHDMFYRELERSTNQLFTLALAGVLDANLKEREVQRLPAFASLSDESAPLEASVRSYSVRSASVRSEARPV
jgi:hypothetical protein